MKRYTGLVIGSLLICMIFFLSDCIGTQSYNSGNRVKSEKLISFLENLEKYSPTGFKIISEYLKESSVYSHINNFLDIFELDILHITKAVNTVVHEICHKILKFQDDGYGELSPHCARGQELTL